MPSRENIAKICQDCKAQLYDSYYFNFITPISRTLLEDLAKAALEANCVTQISKARNVMSQNKAFYVVVIPKSLSFTTLQMYIHSYW